MLLLKKSAVAVYARNMRAAVPCVCALAHRQVSLLFLAFGLITALVRWQPRLSLSRNKTEIGNHEKLPNKTLRSVGISRYLPCAKRVL